MKAIIVHGTKGSPQGNWYLWLASELEKLGVETVVPEMPTPENQTLTNWIEAFNKQCGYITEETILIGHSCGAVLIMRLLEKYNIRAAATVLVSPPYGELGIPEYDDLNSSFLSDSFDWSKIVSNAGLLLYLMGDNDPYVPQDQLLTIANSLNVKPLVIKGGGHLNAEAGFATFPQLLYLLSKFVGDDKKKN